MMKSLGLVVLFVLLVLLQITVRNREIKRAQNTWEQGCRLTTKEIDETIAHLERYGYKADRAKSLHKNERVVSLLKNTGGLAGGKECVVIGHIEPRPIDYIDTFRITLIVRYIEGFVDALSCYFGGDKETKNEWTPAGSKRPVEGSIAPALPEQKRPAHAIDRAFSDVRGGGGGH